MLLLCTHAHNSIIICYANKSTQKLNSTFSYSVQFYHSFYIAIIVFLGVPINIEKLYFLRKTGVPIESVPKITGNMVV